MSLFNKFNGGNPFNVDTKDFEFITMAEQFEATKGKAFKVQGFFINKNSKYGAHPVAILEDKLLDMPAHEIAHVNEILANEEMIEAVKAGKCKIKCVEYHSEKFNKDCIGVEWE